MRETLGACSSVCCSGKTSSRLLHPAASLGLSVENTTWETESNFVRSCFRKLFLFCGKVCGFTHDALLLRTGRCPGNLKGIHPKATVFCFF